MKEVKMYQCEFCGTQYCEAETAKRCEERHVKIKEITRTLYYSKLHYPSFIRLKFEDGSIHQYQINDDNLGG